MYKPPDITTCPAAFLFLFLNAFFRGCSCLNCTNQVGMLTAERKLVHLTVLLVHLRQVHPLKAPSAVQSDGLKRN